MPEHVAQSTTLPASPAAWYSYAVVRVVPRVERGECINVGVILFARESGFLDARIELDPQRLIALDPGANVTLIEQHLRTFCDICRGEPAGGLLAELPASERFHWLTAPRSTIIQTSPVHVGSTTDPEQTLDELLTIFVRPPAGEPVARD